MSGQQEGQGQVPVATDTAGGVLVGTDPATPPQGGVVQDPAQGQPVNSGQAAGEQGHFGGQPPLTQPTQQTPQGLFTEEQMAQARREEKDKLYPEMQSMREELTQIRQEREEAAKERERLAKEAAEAEKAREEAEMDTRQLLERREAEWTQQFENLNRTLQERDAILAKEQELRELEVYTQQVLAQNQETIMPQLRHYVGGNTIQEIDASVLFAQEQTQSILNDVAAAAAPQPFAQARGAAPTAPPVGPMEQQTTYENLTPADIASMDMETYKRHRDTLVPAAVRQYNAGR